MDIINNIYGYLIEKYNNRLYISYKINKFVGCKYKNDDKYFIFFISFYLNNLTLTYRNDVNANVKIRENIEEVSLDELYTKIDNIINNALKNKPEIILKNIYIPSKIKLFPKSYIQLEQKYFEYDNFKIQKEFDSYQYEKYIDFGMIIGQKTQDILSQFLAPRSFEIFKMRMNFSDFENNTYEKIGQHFELSRQRARQIVSKVIKKCKSRKNYLVLKSEYVTLFNQIPIDDFLNYLIIGIQYMYNEEFLKFVLNIIDSDFSDKILLKIKNIFSEEKKQQKYNDFRKKVESKILKMFIFPDITCNDSEKVFDSFIKMRKTFENNNNGIEYVPNLDSNVEYESFLEKNVIANLGKCSFVKKIKSQSVKIEYMYKNEKYDYYPDIQLLMNDNKIVIIEIKPFAFMADYKNIAKYNALKKYCEENGFGYSMMDDRYHSFNDFLNIEVSKEIEKDFMEELKKCTMMNYRDFLEYKNKTNISFIQVGKIAIDNNSILEFHVKPFSIKFININQLNVHK